MKDDYGKDDFNNNNDDCFKSYNVKKLLGDFENRKIQIIFFFSFFFTLLTINNLIKTCFRIINCSA